MIISFSRLFQICVARKTAYVCVIVSWVRTVNGMNKYVTETSEEILVASVGDRSTRKPVSKVEPRPTPTLTLSLVSHPNREREWG